MRDIALVMLAVLGALLLLTAVSLRGGWRLVVRMAALGAGIICVELAVIQLVPAVGGWVLEVTK